MKKFFALVLAVAMIMSMAAVSMAANANADFEVYGPFDYDSDTDQMSGMGGIQYGDTAYFILTDAVLRAQPKVIFRMECTLRIDLQF